MTDQGPMQPDYRRRMEAALAEVTDTDLLLKLSDQAVAMWRARAEAAEQRVKELERQYKVVAALYRSAEADCQPSGCSCLCHVTPFCKHMAPCCDAPPAQDHRQMDDGDNGSDGRA